MTRCHYLFAGLRIASELPLPEWTVFEEPEPFESDVTISYGRSEPSPPDAREWPLVRPDEYRFVARDAGHYRICGGREIVVTPAPGAGDREVRLFLLGSALGALFYQRGLLCLHASVVRTDNWAVALCGPPGAGKSTFAAWLCEHGYRFVADDLCRFECTASRRAVVHPSTPRLKLWRDALTTMGRGPDALVHDHRRAEKFHVAVHHDDARRPVLLKAIYLLDWGRPDITRLRGLKALRQLVDLASYRADLLDRMGQTAAHWQRCRDLADCVKIFRFTRRRDTAELVETVQFFRTHSEDGQL